MSLPFHSEPACGILHLSCRGVSRPGRPGVAGQASRRVRYDDWLPVGFAAVRFQDVSPAPCGIVRYQGNCLSRADPAGGRRKLPPVPANPRNDRVESPAHGGNPGLSPLLPESPRPACTPEVAGSSPVAPVKTILQIGIFCCSFGANDRRLSNRSRAHPAGKSPGRGRSPKSAANRHVQWRDGRVRVVRHLSQIPHQDFSAGLLGARSSSR
jgi:hypothetical protein